MRDDLRSDSQDQSFKICLIGCGEMANNGHGPALARFAAQNSQVFLAGCCDIEGERAAMFATTAIHGIDLVSYLAGAYQTINYTYLPLPVHGAQVAHYHLQAQLAGGARASLFFRPAAGVIFERYQVIQAGRTGLLHLPVWNNPDSPGLAVWYDQGQKTWEEKGTADPFDIINGFFAETAGFYTPIMMMNRIVPAGAEGRRNYIACRSLWPAGDLETSCDAVRVAEALRQRLKVLKLQD